MQNLRLHSPQELIQHVVHVSGTNCFSVFRLQLNLPHPRPPEQLEGLGAFLDGDALVPWSWSGASAFGDEQVIYNTWVIQMLL